MDQQLGIVLERPSALDRASGKPLWGDMGQVLRRTLQHYGVNADECPITYVLPDPKITGERIALVKPQVARIQQELAGVRKILACGALSVAATYPLDVVPNRFHQFRGRGFQTAWGTPTKFVIPTYSPGAIWADSDRYRDLCFDVQKWVNQEAPLPVPDVQVVVVRTVDELRQQLEHLSQASIIAVDLETTGFDPLKDTIDSIGLGVMFREGVRGLTVIVPREMLYPKSQYTCGLLSSFLGPRSPYKGTIVFQNMQFDLRFLYTYLDTWCFHVGLADTLLVNYALDERPIGRYGVHSLKDMSRVRFDAPNYKWDWETWYATPPEQRDWEKMWAYNALDCYYTAKMHEVLDEELNAAEPQLSNLVQDILIPGAKAVAKIVLKGVLIDQPYLRSYGEKLTTLIKEREEEMQAFAEQHGISDLAPASPVQVANFLYGTLGLEMPKIKLKDKREGEWSTCKAALDKVRRHATEEQRSFLDALLAYRLFDKTLSTYVLSLLDKVSVDGRIHPDLIIPGTATGRLSSRTPNLQNQPIHTGREVRRAFISPKGYTLIEADYSQLELRMAAYLSQEPVLINAFNSGQDIHRMTASQVFGIPPEEVSDEARFISKSISFGLLYGRSAEAIAEGREMDMLEDRTGSRWGIERCQAFHDDFLARMPVLANWIQTHIKETRSRQYTMTPFGRMRRFPLLLYHQRGEIERQAVNTLVQSSASDICFTSLIRLVDALPEGAACILTVHDSIIVESRDDLVPAVCQIMRDIMEHPPILEDRGIPWTVDIHTAKNWSDMKS